MMTVVEVDTERVRVAYEQVGARLWRAVLAYGRSRDVADDAVAEAFAQALRRGSAIDDVERWVWRAAFRIADGELARRSTSRDLPMDDTASDPSLVEFLDDLQSLTPQQRRCIVLRYLGGYPPREIATMLGTSSGVVRVQLHHAHRSLRSELEKG